MVPLGTLAGGPDSYGRAINNGGQVAGDSAASNSTGTRLGVHAFVYDRGTLTDLGTLGGAFSSGTGINASGQVTGSSGLPDGTQAHAFIHSNGTIRSIGTLGGAASSGADINDRGEITGTSETADGRTRAFIYSGGAMRELGTLSADFSSGNAINNRGQVVGVSSVPAPPGQANRHAFLYSDGVMLDMGLLNRESFALDINDASQAVGWSWSADGLSRRGFVYADGVLHDVNALLVSAEWFIEQAAGINNLGQIAATGCREPGVNCQAVRLDPVVSSGSAPTSGVASLLAAATLAMVAATRRLRQATLPARILA